MQKRDGRTLFSAGDVVAFLECEHATTLALADLETPLPRAEDDASLRLVVAEIPSDGAPQALARATEQAMREGADVIFQAALLSGPEAGPFYGRADFLRRVEEPSALGAWRYEAADTKLARACRWRAAD